MMTNKKQIAMILYGYPAAGTFFAPSELEEGDVRETAEMWARTLTPVVPGFYTLKLDIYDESGVLMFARRWVDDGDQGEWEWQDGDRYGIVRDESPYIVSVDGDKITIEQAEHDPQLVRYGPHRSHCRVDIYPAPDQKGE